MLFSKPANIHKLPLPFRGFYAMIIDTHCHLASSQFDQSRRETYVQHALQANTDRMITLGARPDDWEMNIAWARQFPGVVFCALGIHPDDAHEAPEGWTDRLFQIAQDIPLAAIGETGLDYFHVPPPGWEQENFRRLQQNMLEQHFDLAARLGLNIVLHTRDRKGSASFEDALAIARNHAGRVRPVFHCFIGNAAQATRIFDELDGMVSFTGVATFKNASAVAETASWCPENRIMLETDSPYLSPEPLRGRMNEPAHLIHTARFIAVARGMNLEDLAHVTTRNAETFYNLGKV